MNRRDFIGIFAKTSALIASGAISPTVSIAADLMFTPAHRCEVRE